MKKLISILCLGKRPVILLIITLLIAGCSSNDNGNITGNNENLVKITIAFVGGFDEEVMVIYNKDPIFWAFISGVASFAWPQAEFTTYLPKGKNTLDIRWRFSGEYRTETVEFELLDAEEYFIGLTFSDKDDTLSFRVFDYRPGYL